MFKESCTLFSDYRRFIQHIPSYIIVILVKMLKYSSVFLRNFRKIMHDPNNYHAFSLDTATRSWIIALGVQKKFTQTPYR